MLYSDYKPCVKILLRQSMYNDIQHMKYKLNKNLYEIVDECIGLAVKDYNERGIVHMNKLLIKKDNDPFIYKQFRISEENYIGINRISSEFKINIANLGYNIISCYFILLEKNKPKIMSK